MRFSVLAVLLLTACGSKGSSGTGATGAGGEDTGQAAGAGGGGTGGVDDASVTAGITTGQVTTGAGGAGGSGEGGASTASSSTASTSGAGGDGGQGGETPVGCPAVECPDPPVPGEDYVCDATCSGNGCANQVCQSLDVPLQTGQTLRVVVPPVTSRHPMCTENCGAGPWWAMRFRLPPGQRCLSVVGPDGTGWGVAGSAGGNDSPACFLGIECGAVQSYGGDGITRYVTFGVPADLDLPSGGVFTIRVEDATNGCPIDPDEVEAECTAVGCNGDGGVE